MNEITLMFLLLWSSGSHLTSAVYVRSPEEVVVGNETTDTEAVLNQQSSGALMQKGPRPHPGCGVPAIQPKVPACPSDGLGIVNGEEAEPHSWPWQASLQTDSGSHFCGGSLIGRNWVVTAAHCEISKSHRVILGLHDRENTKKIQKKIIGKVFNHPNWNNKTLDYDIALIKLQYPAQMNEHVSPVCVAETCDKFYGGMECVATGWGYTRYQGPELPLKLEQVCLPLIGHDQCKSNHWGSSITGRMICAGAAGSVTCQGDSGGPLVCKKNGAWNLVGVTSFVEEGCITSTPGVFAYVPNLRAWMDRTIADN